MLKWPKKVCVLDVETELSPWKKEKPKVFLVGTLLYNKLNKGRYRLLGYKYYLQESLSELQTFLNDFDGIILGFNIFDFDYYKVLAHHLNLKNIINKTVDLYSFWIFLKLKIGFDHKFLYTEGVRYSRGGSSLRTLSKYLLNEDKFKLDKSIWQKWEQGQKRELINYNRRDCMLTFQLWKWFIADSDNYNRSIPFYPYIYCLRDMNTRHKLILTGQRKLFTYSSWKKAIKKAGSPMKPMALLDVILNDLIFANQLRFKKGYKEIDFRTILKKFDLSSRNLMDWINMRSISSLDDLEKFGKKVKKLVSQAKDLKDNNSGPFRFKWYVDFNKLKSVDMSNPDEITEDYMAWYDEKKGLETRIYSSGSMSWWKHGKLIKFRRNIKKGIFK